MTWSFDLEAVEADLALEAKQRHAQPQISGPWAVVEATLEPALRRAFQVCSVPLVLDDLLAWNLVRTFVRPDKVASRVFFQLKAQSFLRPTGRREWTLPSDARHFFLSRLDRETQRNVHKLLRDWFEGAIRSRSESDEHLVDLFSTYHLTPEDETAGLARWRALSRPSGHRITQRFAVAEMTQDLQQLGWLSKENLEPPLYRALYLYECGRSAEASVLFRSVSDTERDEWPVGVAKHCLANLVRKGRAPAKEGVDSVRYAEGLLWRAKRILENADDTIGQVHVCTTLAQVLSDQGRFRGAVALLRENVQKAVGRLSQVQMRHILANTLVREEMVWRRRGALREQRLNEALTLLRDGASIASEVVPELRGELAKLLVTQSKVEQWLGNLTAAESTAIRAVELAKAEMDRKQESYALDRLGRVFLAKLEGTQDEATRHELGERAVSLFRMAAELTPEDRSHLRGLATGLLRIGRVEEASEIIDRELRESG